MRLSSRSSRIHTIMGARSRTPDVNDGDVEGATAKVEDHHALVVARAETQTGKLRRRRLLRGK
eukprot:6214013-Pleurochrysis_carterae.AAC.4